MNRPSSGILLQSVGRSDLAIEACQSLNNLTDTNPYLDIIIFYRSWTLLPMPIRFSIMMDAECWGVSKTLISTDIKTTQTLIKCVGPQKKYFYVWDLEWLERTRDMYYGDLAHIYNNPNIELIARNEQHYNILHQMWKKPLCIMKDFDSQVLGDICS